MAAISGAWLEALKGEFKKPYYKKLFETVNQEYRTRNCMMILDVKFQIMDTLSNGPNRAY